ncbi:MAG: hypothetical protein R6T98_03920 [Desulfatiglandales bacterium]
MQNLTIFVIVKKVMDFSEATGGLRLRFKPIGLPGRSVGPTTRRKLKKSPSPLKKEELGKAIYLFTVY